MTKVKSFFSDVRNKEHEKQLQMCVAALNNIIADNEGLHLLRTELYYLLTEDLQRYYLAYGIDEDSLPVNVTRILHLSKKMDNVYKTVYDIRCYQSKEHLGVIEVKHELLKASKIISNR